MNNNNSSRSNSRKQQQQLIWLSQCRKHNSISCHDSLINSSRNIINSSSNSSSSSSNRGSSIIDRNSILSSSISAISLSTTLTPRGHWTVRRPCTTPVYSNVFSPFLEIPSPPLPSTDQIRLLRK